MVGLYLFVFWFGLAARVFQLYLEITWWLGLTKRLVEVSGGHVELECSLNHLELNWAKTLMTNIYLSHEFNSQVLSAAQIAMMPRQESAEIFWVPYSMLVRSLEQVNRYNILALSK
jgi:hypothetical protein